MMQRGYNSTHVTGEGGSRLHAELENPKFFEVGCKVFLRH